MSSKREWDKVRAKLKPRFERAGITRCEFRYDGCTGNFALSFAHAFKRRFIKPGELEVVALADAVCHDKLDTMSHKKMHREVMRVIKQRICQP